VLIFVSGVAAALGGLATPRLTDLTPERRLLPLLLVTSSLGLVALVGARSAWAFTTVRFLQSLCIAPLFPLVVARVAQRGSVEAISVVTSARTGGGFVGPVLATSILAWGPPALLYLAMASVGLACVPLTRPRFARVGLTVLRDRFGRRWRLRRWRLRRRVDLRWG